MLNEVNSSSVSQYPIRRIKEPTLWNHQNFAIGRASDLFTGHENNLGLFFDVGTGKTLTLIMILRMIFANHNLKRTLIFCPPIVVENWKREFQKFSTIPEGEVVCLQGTGKDRQQILKTTKAHVLITNYESMLSTMKELPSLIRGWKPEILVCDESQMLKDPTAQRTKALIDLAKTTEYRFILSGTPILNSYMDIFSQFLILDKGKTFGTNFFVFRARYFYDKNAGMPKQSYFPDYRPRPGIETELKQLVGKISLVAKKSECLDLPPLVKTQVFVELSPEQRKAYNQMKEDFLTVINDQACAADLALTKALRLQQIVSGHLPVEGIEDGSKNLVVFEKTPREKALFDLVEKMHTDHKIIIWSVYQCDYDVIRGVCNKLKIEYTELHGGVSAGNRQKNVDTFNNNPKCRVLVGHPKAGGVGVNLIASDVSIYYSRNFSLEYELQSEARNYRGGSEIHSKITHINIIARDTIDELVVESLQKKEQLGLKILKAQTRSI